MRRGRRPRPKTISGTGVTGQKGVNLIEGIVLDMESRWTPSGPNEVGIDGYIELFDPASRKALGLTLAAQSKAATGVGSDPKPTFDFWCAPADLEYWTAGNMPVIMVVSDPASKDAWWVPVKDYFKDWTPGSTTTVTFRKDEQRFTKHSFKALAALAAPKPGVYLAPARKTERLLPRATSARTSRSAWPIRTSLALRVESNIATARRRNCQKSEDQFQPARSIAS